MKWSLPLVLALAAGIGLVVLLESVALPRPRRGFALVAAGAVGLALLVAVYPARYHGVFWRDPYPSVTAFLITQPAATLVAGPPHATDFVPTFARRPVQASREHALPFHSGYLALQRPRLDDLVSAYYAESPVDVARFVRQYGVNVLLVDGEAFDLRTFRHSWTGFVEGWWEPYTSRIAGRSRPNARFALLDLARRCARLEDGNLIVILTAQCSGAGRQRVTGCLVSPAAEPIQGARQRSTCSIA